MLSKSPINIDEKYLRRSEKKFSFENSHKSIRFKLPSNIEEAEEKQFAKTISISMTLIDNSNLSVYMF